MKTGLAYVLKEDIRDLWEYNTVAWAKKYWIWWYNWAPHSNLKLMVKVARLLRRHMGKILNFVEHCVATAMSEGANGKIQVIKRSGYGYRNRENFKTAILFHCEGLSLHP